ncbi:MAG: glutathione S-transferase [Myxococcales bacterium]|nr:glutathione S-transferase [Myxococcales bacterium]MCB9575701.1 glutathione S-transferase [Polyangiaceae bacterium]
MKLYWCPKTRSLRILWLMEESGLPYERVVQNIRDAEAKNDPAFRAISPMGKVPAFEDGPVRLWDSGAIATYLADQYPETKLGISVGDPNRGAYLQWLMFTNSVVEPAMGEKFANLPSNPSSYGWGSWDLMLEVFRAGVEKGPFLFGEHFTGADVLMGMSAQYMREFGMLKDDPVLFGYAARCIERPAYKRAIELEASTKL